ncbi:hypothetical protein HDU67_007241 [Dinochytrium kinnereticum]|nr:hypothetical protein HDU67_007241 [Dinochytrium kinnereticum]
MSFLQLPKQSRPKLDYECFETLVKLLRIKILERYRAPSATTSANLTSPIHNIHNATGGGTPDAATHQEQAGATDAKDRSGLEDDLAARLKLDLKLDTQAFIESATDVILNRKSLYKKEQLEWRRNAGWRIVTEVIGSRIPLHVSCADSDDDTLVFSDAMGSHEHPTHASSGIDESSLESSGKRDGRALIKNLEEIRRVREKVLALAADDIENAKSVLVRFYNIAHDHPNSHLYLFLFLRFTNASSHEWAPVAARYVRADPSVHPDLALRPLVTHLEELAELNPKEKSASQESMEQGDEEEEEVSESLQHLVFALDILAIHLEVCSGTAWVWQAFLRLILKLSCRALMFDEADFFADKLRLWCWRHFPTCLPNTTVISEEREERLRGSLPTDFERLRETSRDEFDLYPATKAYLFHQAASFEMNQGDQYSSAIPTLHLDISSLESGWMSPEIHELPDYAIPTSYTPLEIERHQGYALDDHWGKCDCCSPWDLSSSDEDRLGKHPTFLINPAKSYLYRSPSGPKKRKPFKRRKRKGQRSETDEEIRDEDDNKMSGDEGSLDPQRKRQKTTYKGQRVAEISCESGEEMNVKAVKRRSRKKVFLSAEIISSDEDEKTREAPNSPKELNPPSTDRNESSSPGQPILPSSEVATPSSRRRQVSLGQRGDNENEGSNASALSLQTRQRRGSGASTGRRRKEPATTETEGNVSERIQATNEFSPGVYTHEGPSPSSPASSMSIVLELTEESVSDALVIPEQTSVAITSSPIRSRRTYKSKPALLASTGKSDSSPPTRRRRRASIPASETPQRILPADEIITGSTAKHDDRAEKRKSVDPFPKKTRPYRRRKMQRQPLSSAFVEMEDDLEPQGQLPPVDDVPKHVAINDEEVEVSMALPSTSSHADCPLAGGAEDSTASSCLKENDISPQRTAVLRRSRRLTGDLLDVTSSTDTQVASQDSTDQQLLSAGKSASDPTARSRQKTSDGSLLNPKAVTSLTTRSQPTTLVPVKPVAAQVSSSPATDDGPFPQNTSSPLRALKPTRTYSRRRGKLSLDSIETPNDRAAKNSVESPGPIKGPHGPTSPSLLATNDETLPASSQPDTPVPFALREKDDDSRPTTDTKESPVGLRRSRRALGLGVEMGSK